MIETPLTPSHSATTASRSHSVTTTPAPGQTGAGPGDAWRQASSRAIHPSAHAGDEPLVSVIATGLAAVSVPWELTGETTTSERSYELLLSTDLYDAWLIHWPAGTGLEAHDHGGSTGAFAVVSGVLDEDIDVDGVTFTRRLRAGQHVAFEGDHVHAVVNRSDVGATSVHVYSPPLRSMSYYDVPSVDGARIVSRIEQIDTVEPR